MKNIKNTLGVIVALTFSGTILAVDSFETEWSEPVKIISIAGYAEGPTDTLSISFSDSIIKNPKKCSKASFYTLTPDSANGIGQSLLSLALAGGTANLDVQYKVHRTTCHLNRPVITELKVNFQ